MREILRTTDLSLIESFRIAADAEGIETLITADNFALGFSPSVIAVVDDAAYEQAYAILQTLQRTSRARRKPLSELFHAVQILILLVLIGAFFFCMNVLFD